MGNGHYNSREFRNGERSGIPGAGSDNPSNMVDLLAHLYFDAWVLVNIMVTFWELFCIQL